MPLKHAFRIVLVKPGHGVGAESEASADRSVTYQGHLMKIELGK
jgi:hypothetical protein